MNWGAKIFLTLAVFMIAIVAAGIYMVRKNTDTLVEEDYYERGIHYDEVYNRKKNLEDQQAHPAVSVVQDSLLIVFVHPGNKGELLLKRTSDRSSDRRIPFTVPGDRLLVSLDSLSKGAWEMHLEWTGTGGSFEYVKQLYF